jgi:hypothetical protein
MHTNTFITYLHKKNHENPNIIRPCAEVGKQPPVEKPAHEKTVSDIIRDREPEAPGFEKDRLMLRHTFAFSLARLARLQEAQEAQAEKNVPILLPMEKWLSSKITVTKEKELSPIEEFWQMRKEKSSYAILPGGRIIDLQTLAGGDYSHSSYPLMMHAPAANREAVVTREKMMQIEQTITTQTRQLEKRLNDALRAPIAHGKIAGDGILVNQQEIKLSSLTDGVYNMLLERIKKEKSMRGY